MGVEVGVAGSAQARQKPAVRDRPVLVAAPAACSQTNVLIHRFEALLGTGAPSSVRTLP